MGEKKSLNAQQLLQQGIAMARAGHKEQARQALMQVIRIDPQSLTAWLWLADVVESQKQRRDCLERAVHLAPHNQAIRQALLQLQSPAPTSVSRGGYFLGYQSSSQYADSIERIATQQGYHPLWVNRDDPDNLLLRLCQTIFRANLTVFDLSEHEPNTYIELGVALAFNRPILILSRADVILPFVLRAHTIVRYHTLSDFETHLTHHLVDLINIREQASSPDSLMTDYCYVCRQICPAIATPPDENAYLILNESRLLWRGLTQVLAPHLAGYHLYPVYLSDQIGSNILCDTRQKVLASQFALGHLGHLSNEHSFLALGIAIGSQIPWILLAQAGETAVPTDLLGFPYLEYTQPNDLLEPLTLVLSDFLGRVSVTMPLRDTTSFLTLSFWAQLRDWIAHTRKSGKETKVESAEQFQLLQYEGERRVARHSITGKGLVVGRSHDCDVVVEHPSVSSYHFRVMPVRALQTRSRCHVEDLGSKNGTFLNGVRLTPHERVGLRPRDTIRIPGARFLVWAEEQLPTDQPRPTYKDTGLLPPILRIELPDIPPPTYMSNWEHPTVLTVVLPDGINRAMFEVQSYYPVGRILAQLQELLDLPPGRYRFQLRDTLLDDDETPLSINLKREDVLVMVTAS